MSDHLSFHPNLYLSEEIDSQELHKIKKKLEKKPLFSGLFLIVLSTNENDQLEYFDAKQLIQPYYEKKCFQVVGLANSSGEAQGLVTKMLQDCLDQRGDCNLKEFLKWEP